MGTNFKNLIPFSLVPGKIETMRVTSLMLATVAVKYVLSTCGYYYNKIFFADELSSEYYTTQSSYSDGSYDIPAVIIASAAVFNNKNDMLLSPGSQMVQSTTLAMMIYTPYYMFKTFITPYVMPGDDAYYLTTIGSMYLTACVIKDETYQAARNSLETKIVILDTGAAFIKSTVGQGISTVGNTLGYAISTIKQKVGPTIVNTAISIFSTSSDDNSNFIDSSSNDMYPSSKQKLSGITPGYDDDGYCE